MFERFTEQARHVVVYAQEEARGLNHAYIGTEHLLLGLLRERDGLAARALKSHGLELDRVRADVVRIVRVGETPPRGQVPFTPRATRVIELAARAAARDIRSEHLLVGLAGENEGVAARVLIDFGVDPAAIRSEMLRLLEEGGQGRSREPASAPSREVVPLDAAWLGALASVLEPLAADIGRELLREPDAGDLLLALASLDGALTGRAARAAGVDVETLADTIEQLRGEAAKTGEDRRRAIEAVSRAKEEAIDAGQFERATDLRDRERELRAESESHASPAEEALAAIRRRLGIRPPEVHGGT